MSFLSDTLRSNDTLGKERKEERTASVAKEEKEKTPRSPCLKRIHFQRTEAQLRSAEVFQSRAEFKFNLTSTRKNSVEKQETKSEQVGLFLYFESLFFRETSSNVSLSPHPGRSLGRKPPKLLTVSASPFWPTSQIQTDSQHSRAAIPLWFVSVYSVHMRTF